MTELLKVMKGLRQLRKRLAKLDKRLERVPRSICTSYELFAFKDQGRQLIMGHLPDLDWHDKHD